MALRIKEIGDRRREISKAIKKEEQEKEKMRAEYDALKKKADGKMRAIRRIDQRIRGK